jgi:glucose-6-phosphate isomerase
MLYLCTLGNVLLASTVSSFSNSFGTRRPPFGVKYTRLCAHDTENDLKVSRSPIPNDNEVEINGEYVNGDEDIYNLKIPQIHLPPRLAPGVAWHHHHAATTRLIHGDETSGEGGVGRILSNLIPGRSQLVSSTQEWKTLEKEAEEMKNTHLRDLLQDKERCDQMFATHDGVYLDYSRQRASLETMEKLLELAEKQELKKKIQAMFNGEKINFTEDRAVLHTALRADRKLEGTVFVDGMDVIKEVHEVLDQIKYFTNGVRSGEIRGYTGKRLRNIVSVGIGGSYLGPEFLHETLKTEPEGINSALGYSLRFLANVDPVDVERTCADLDPEETLIVIVSKTFTTAETMLNARAMRQWLWDFMGDDKEVVRKHFVACASVSATEKVEAFGIDTENYFFRFWDWVGGRYSVCSAAGAVPISLLYGYDLFEKFLQGANSIDKHFLEAPFDKNIPVIMGLLGVWNMSFMGYNTRAALPYAEALLKLPAHIQQLDMESNGKCMTKFGVEVDYPVGEIDFGEPGTNGQHSFYQLLHMGQTVASDFIGFVQSQHDLCLDDESVSSHDELMANFFAQPDALACGKTAQELRVEGVAEDLIPHRTFKGNRPSMSLLLPKLTAYATGQLLAIYEHRTAVQGFMWDINSFDQWGVELGKKLAIDVKEELLEARRAGDGYKVDTGRPATDRILNYYIENSDESPCVEGDSGNPTTKITRKTHREHYPPMGHDLGGSSGKLS